jgi:hypothetical protein
MKKWAKSLFITGAGLFLGSQTPVDAQSKAKAPAKKAINASARKTPVSAVRKQINELKKHIGNYAENLIDERPVATYDATKDFLAYPVKVNYTVDTLQYSNGYNAQFQEAVTVFFDRETDSSPQGQKDFNHRVAPDVVHEMLHFIQKEKLKHLMSQDVAGNLNFGQAYEIAACKEVASHVADKLALEMNAAHKFDFAKFVGIINRETKRFMKQGSTIDLYRKQFFGEAEGLFNPNAKTDNEDGFMKTKAAILTVFVNVDGEMKPINLLPLLIKANVDLITIPQSEQNKYVAERAAIDRGAEKNTSGYGQISDEQKKQLLIKRFRSFHRGMSVRSAPQNMDVSAYFPKMSTAEYEMVESFCRQPDTVVHQEKLANMLQQSGEKQLMAHNRLVNEASM